jgi:hypothetical protein
LESDLLVLTIYRDTAAAVEAIHDIDLLDARRQKLEWEFKKRFKNTSIQKIYENICITD